MRKNPRQKRDKRVNVQLGRRLWTSGPGPRKRARTAKATGPQLFNCCLAPIFPRSPIVSPISPYGVLHP